jgi:hypothetical protein
MEPASGEGNRRHFPRVVMVGVVLTVATSTMLAFFFLYPVPHSVSVRDSFSMPLPYNASQDQCAWSSFGNAGTYSFTVDFLNGNVIFLTVTSPTNSTVYHGFGESHIAGTINEVSGGAYEFCLSTTINYSYEGGFATVNGTLTHSLSSPLF